MSAVNNLAKKLVLKRDLSPEGRITNYKGRIRQAMAAISANMTKLVLLNLLMVVACAPLIATYFVMRSQEAAAVAGLNFSTGIGVGFGVSDDTMLAIERIYDIRLRGYGLVCSWVCLRPGYTIVAVICFGRPKSNYSSTSSEVSKTIGISLCFHLLGLAHWLPALPARL